tara:strand:- start:2438 stop:2959 length:522 start_codon:yes stop_codon:yes gene_type:complete
MGKFNNKISAEYTPPKNWVLERALSYKNEEMEVEALEAIGVKCPSNRITCKKGFKTDLASVPRLLWNLIAPWDVARAAIIHDLLYKRIRQYRVNGEKDFYGHKIIDENKVKKAKKASDKIFLMAMKDAEPSVAKWKIYSAYYAVVLFGRWSIIPRDEDMNNGSYRKSLLGDST